MKNKAPAPRETTVTVLNGNGVSGSAGTASYLLSQRGYQMVYPPDGKNANAPNWDYFKTEIAFDPKRAGAELAARKVADLFGSGAVVPISPKIAALSNGAMLTVTVGQTFHGTLAEAPIDKTPQRQKPNVAPGADASLALLRERARKLPFPVMVPTVLERTSWIDREKPVWMYRIDPEGKHKTLRLTYRTGGARVLGRADDRLGGRAGALGAQLRPLDQGAAATSSTTTARSCTWSCSGRAARPTGSSTRSSTRSRTRPCSRSRRVSSRSPRSSK